MTPRAPGGRAIRGDSGAALVLVLVALAGLSAAGAHLMLVAETEVVIAGHYQAAQEALVGAEGLLERTIAEVSSAGFTAVLSGAAPSTFRVGGRTPRLPSGATVSLDLLTSQLQATMPAAWGANRPQWRLHGWGPLDALTGPAGAGRPVYLVAWVADDPGEVDDDPGTDTNGVVLVRVEAFGAGGARRAVQATLADPAGVPGARAPVRILSWREPR